MISIVIPSYNRRDCMLALLRDVYQQQDVDFEVIVVDDASSDDSANAIKLAFPEVILLCNDTNGGPCVSRNRGIRHARGEIVVGFDSDVTLNDRGLLQNVVKSFGSTPSITGFAFRIFNPDGITDDIARWWHPVPINVFADRIFETYYFSGTAYAFRRQPMLAAGLFPEIFYMHYEEVELAMRIVNAGGSIMYSPALKVLHHADKVSNRSEIKRFYKPRNQILLALRCFSAWRAVIYIMPRVAFQFILSIFNLRANHFLRALWSAIRLAPSCLLERTPISQNAWSRIQRMKKIRD